MMALNYEWFISLNLTLGFSNIYNMLITGPYIGVHFSNDSVL